MAEDSNYLKESIHYFFSIFLNEFLKSALKIMLKLNNQTCRKK